MLGFVWRLERELCLAARLRGRSASNVGKVQQNRLDLPHYLCHRKHSTPYSPVKVPYFFSDLPH